MRILQMSDTTQIDGPGQSFNAMTTNETVADRLRPFLNQGAASATFGNLLTLPMGGGLLYVTPVYTQRQGSTGSYPALRFVVVRFGQSVGIGDTLQQALDQVFQGSSGGTTEEGGSADGNKPTGKADNPAATKALSEASGSLRGCRQGADGRRSGDVPEEDEEANAAVQRRCARSAADLRRPKARWRHSRGSVEGDAVARQQRATAGLVEGASGLRDRESRCAERVGQPLGIPDHDEGQLVRMDDRAVGLGGCFGSHRTQQRRGFGRRSRREVRREPGWRPDQRPPQRSRSAAGRHR